MDKTGDEEKRMMMGLLLHVPVGAIDGDTEVLVAAAEEEKPPPAAPCSGTTRDSTKRSMDDAAIGTAAASSTEKKYPSRDDIAHMCRSERKRHREKKRRGQVNNGFHDLKALLGQIDPAMQDKEEINRVDLISRAASLIKEMDAENECLKKQVVVVVQEHRHHGGLPLPDERTSAMPCLVPSSRQQDSDGMVVHDQHHQPHTHHTMTELVVPPAAPQYLTRPPPQHASTMLPQLMMSPQYYMPHQQSMSQHISIPPNCMPPQHYCHSADACYLARCDDREQHIS